MKYNIYLNQGNEYLGVNDKTITVNEVLDTVDENALAREISHQNPLIPEQVAKAVLENFCQAVANVVVILCLVLLLESLRRAKGSCRLATPS